LAWGGFSVLQAPHRIALSLSLPRRNRWSSIRLSAGAHPPEPGAPYDIAGSGWRWRERKNGLDQG
jgi:hypothetical protein